MFEAYPIVYTEGHNLQPGPAGLVYLPLPIGSILAVIVVCVYFTCCPRTDQVSQFVVFINTDYTRKVQEYAPEPVPPEYRLRAAMIAGPLLTISMFWFA